MHSNLESIELVFLPPNTTYEIQPFDKGIIKKLCYIYIHSANIQLDALQMTRKAWDSVTPSLITNCLSKGGCTRREQDECICEVSPEEGSVDDLTSIMIEQLGVTASF